MTEDDLDLLHRTVELATEALTLGNSPYGSLLVDPHGAVVFEDHNRDADGDLTRHPEFAIAKYAIAHYSPEERAACTVYTSTEHCAMCAGGHAWAGLGKIYCATTGAQTAQWYAKWGAEAGPLTPLSAAEVSPNIQIEGPAPRFEEVLYDLHRWFYLGEQQSQ
ncbi:nucleoside deaminase [Corynebacterium crudilactis]|uniref:Cytidine deaminase n=1 Tax=Corynebacterium crudilactis TaxID=1652495 RepID=A0A172QRK5_9CORY|nr:nucleoside deaminase [Corynebacterium crudilactis]ANE03325.1 cytidine deaminase [Corynebacterium crudilactis]